VQKLIERYPQPEHLNWADFRGWSAVTEAAANGRLDVLRQLIDKGANADAADENRRNILHVASLRGHMDIVRFVLNMKFGMLNAVDAFNATPLMLALDQQRVEVANFLISKGADLTKQDREGYTPAHVATLAGLMDVLKMLRAVDKQVLESADYRGFTPLLLAVGQGNMEVRVRLELLFLYVSLHFLTSSLSDRQVPPRRRRR
jgi:ankyrin repeat protein